MANEATSQVRRVVIYDDATTELRTPSPFTQSKDLWVTLEELTRSTVLLSSRKAFAGVNFAFRYPNRGRPIPWKARQSRMVQFE